jgi:microsomal dipeptidase-like Zn-dependent dipeptidase
LQNRRTPEWPKIGRRRYSDYSGGAKGYRRWVALVSDAIFPKRIKTTSDTPNITKCMMAHGWSEGQIQNVAGDNWLRLSITHGAAMLRGQS